MFWQAMQYRKSSAFLTCSAAGSGSSQGHCGKGGIDIRQLPSSLCFLKTPSLIKITEQFLVIGLRRWTRALCSHGAQLTAFVIAFPSCVLHIL